MDDPMHPMQNCIPEDCDSDNFTSFIPLSWDPLRFLAPLISSIGAKPQFTHTIWTRQTALCCT